MIGCDLLEGLRPLLARSNSPLAGPDSRFVTGQVIFADGGAEATLRGDRQWQD